MRWLFIFIDEFMKGIGRIIDNLSYPLSDFRTKILMVEAIRHDFIGTSFCVKHRKTYFYSIPYEHIFEQIFILIFFQNDGATIHIDIQVRMLYRANSLNIFSNVKTLLHSIIPKKLFLITLRKKLSHSIR